MVSPCFWQIFPRGCSVLNALSTAHGARSALLRRSCDGVAAATELRRPAPSRSFCASRGADPAATELMLRAALLRRSCDGVAAATESLLRRSRCCDGAAQTSSSFALILRVASLRDALNEEPAPFPPGLIQISKVVAHSPNRPPPWPRIKISQGADGRCSTQGAAGY